MKNTAILPLIVAPLLIAGCAGTFGRMREAVNNAPEWYGDRRDEIRGEGYPELADLPTLDPDNLPGKTLPARKSRTGELATIFDNNPRSELAAGGAEEIEAIAADMRSAFAAVPPEDFLTETELAAIRNLFNVPRVTQDEF